LHSIYALCLRVSAGYSAMSALLTVSLRAEWQVTAQCLRCLPCRYVHSDRLQRNVCAAYRVATCTVTRIPNFALIFESFCHHTIKYSLFLLFFAFCLFVCYGCLFPWFCPFFYSPCSSRCFVPSLIFPCASNSQLHSDDNVSYSEGPGFESWSEHKLVFWSTLYLYRLFCCMMTTLKIAAVSICTFILPIISVYTKYFKLIQHRQITRQTTMQILH
jgi:hypothetical protein